MNDFLLTVLSVSLSGAVTAAFIWALQFTFKKRLSHTWKYYIWLVVLIRLLLPFAPQTNLTGSIISAVSQAVQMESGRAQGGEYMLPVVLPQSAPDSGSAPQQGDLDTLPGYTTGDGAPTQHDAAEHIWSRSVNCLTALWLAVCMLLMARKVGGYMQLMHKIRSQALLYTRADGLSSYHQVCAEMGIARPPQLYNSKLVVTPMLTGIFHPAVYLPEVGFKQEQLSCIFRHELTHYKRKDMLYKWVLTAVSCLHWFNPAVYLIGRAVDKQCELSCDESLIRGMSRKDKQIYGDTLIAAVKGSAGGKRHAGVMTLHESIETLKERLESIMTYKRGTKLSAVLSLALVFLITTGAVYAGAYMPKAAAPENAGNVLTDPAVSAGKNADEEGQSGTGGESRVSSTLAYYENNYIVLGQATNFEKEETGTPVTIGTDKTAVTVYFAQEVRSYSANQTVLDTAQKMVQNWSAREHSRFSANDGQWYYYITEVAGPYRETPDALAAQFYEADNIVYFSAVYRSMTDAACRTLMERSIQEDKINFFSILIDRNTAEQEADALSERCYAENRINFFSVVMRQMSSAKQAEMMERAIADNRINFFSVLLNEAEGFDFDAFAEQAYQNDLIQFFAVVSDKLDDAKKLEFFYRAYEDDKINFFSVLLHDARDLTDLSALRNRAYNDGKRNFFYVLWED